MEKNIAYLSEMGISNQHGGGLTINRILGEEGLRRIKHVIHVSRFANETYPNLQYAHRLLEVFHWGESSALRAAVGCTCAKFLHSRQILSDVSAARASSKIASFLHDYKETMRILVCPQSIRSLLVMDHLFRETGFSYLTWIMDDHCVSFENDRWRYPQKIERLMERHLQRANKVFVISPSMQQMYLQRFGVDSEVLFGPSENAGVSDLVLLGSETLRFGYFGNISAWQLDALASLVEHLERERVTLDIYSGVTEIPKCLVHDRIFFRGRVDAAEVKEIMQQYHAVILPISFSAELSNMTRLNIATKMSECLASGTVTFLIGPPEAAMTKFLAGQDCIFIETDIHLPNFSHICRCLRDTEQRSYMIKKSQAFCQEHASVNTMRHRFFAALDG